MSEVASPAPQDGVEPIYHSVEGPSDESPLGLCVLGQSVRTLTHPSGRLKVG
jgi:hypothetical protein